MTNDVSFKKAIESAKKIKENISGVIKGKDDVIDLFLASFFSGGHVLIEDVPGTGKTSLAKALAKTVRADFSRVQFTPDLLPADITGMSIFNKKENSFEFRRGPVFTDIFLADEINRASPRTQSALLESMEEYQVSIEGRRYPLEGLFFVIATQNNAELRGTFELPESQMDRFNMSLNMGYVSEDEEVDILKTHGYYSAIDDIKSVSSAEDVINIRKVVRNITVTDEIKYYIVRIINELRNRDEVKYGASPRASIALMRTSQAVAFLEGRNFVIPDYVQNLAVPVLAHRLLVKGAHGNYDVHSVPLIEDIVRSLTVPA